MDEKFLVLDFETTGKYPALAEVLQVALIDSDGNVLMNELCKPLKTLQWPDAQQVHGISPEMVKDKQVFETHIPKLQEYINKFKIVVSYNAGYEFGVLRKYGFILTGIRMIDPMLMFAPVFGEWNNYFQQYKWQTLTTCAKFYNYNFENAHDALSDVRATLHCYKLMLQDAVRLVEIKTA